MKTPTMRNFSVSLTLYHAAMMDAAVESGSYASNSEIIREGLRLWEMRQEIKKLEMARLRRLAVEDALGGDMSEAEREIITASLKADGLITDWRWRGRSMNKIHDRDLAAVMMTLMTSYSELAIAWREINPSNNASEEVAEWIRRALKGMHSDNTMDDGDEVRAVEKALQFFEEVLKPQLSADHSGNGSNT